MKETQVHLDAFELYYSMKASRSHKAVAEEIGVSIRNVDKWGKDFKWQKRVEERDKKIAEKVAEEVVKKEVDMKVKIYDAIAKTVDKYTEKLLKDGITIETVKDLEVLGKLWKDIEYSGVQVDAVKGQPEGVNESIVQVIIEKPQGVE